MFVLSAQLNVARSNRSRNTATDATAKKSRYCLFRLRFVAAYGKWANESVRTPYFVCLHLWFRKLVNNLLKCARVCLCLCQFMTFCSLIWAFENILLFWCRIENGMRNVLLRLSMIFIPPSALNMFIFQEDETDHSETNRTKQKKKKHHLTLVPFIDSN